MYIIEHISEPLGPREEKQNEERDELDVFEAAGYCANTADDHVSVQRQSIMTEEWRKQARTIERPADRQRVAEKKPKQPLSPGGRLASFLISFFQHGSSIKKKFTISVKGGAANSTGAMKRRISESSFDKKTPSICEPAYGPPTNASNGGRSGYGRRASINGIVEHSGRFDSKSFLFEDRSFRRKEEQEGDSGWESDSSSDLFDLPSNVLDRF